MSHPTSAFLFLFGVCLGACSSEGGAVGPGAAGETSLGVGGSPGAAAGGSSVGGSSAGGSATGGLTGTGGDQMGGANGGAVAGAAAGGSAGADGVSCAAPLPPIDLALPEPGAETEATPLAEADFKDEVSGAPLFHYAISAPKTFAPPAETDPNKQLGLFLCFHEHFGQAHDEPPSVIESLVRLKLSGDFVVIGMAHANPDNTVKAYDPVIDHQNAVKLVEWARKTYPINPRRVYLWGRGEGARMAQELGTEHPELFAGLITYSWGSLILPKVANPSLDIPDFYLANGLDDYPTHPPYVRSVYASVKKLGYNVIYREVPGQGQTVGDLGRTSKHPPSNDDAIAWASRLRHKTLPLSAAEQAVIAPYADATAGRAICPDAQKFRSLSRVGGAAAGAVLAPIFGAQNDTARVMAAQSAGLSLFGDAAATALAENLKDPSADVRKATFEALGIQAGWRSMPSQKALIDVATDKLWDAAERALAVAQLGVAVKMQVGGSFQDPPLFQALVTLLSDEDLALRTAAFAILSPIQASAYKPDAAPADRTTEAGKWQAWLDGIVAKQQ